MNTEPSTTATAYSSLVGEFLELPDMSNAHGICKIKLEYYSIVAVLEMPFGILK